MKSENTPFNDHDVIHDLKHYLPAQAPLKDFIHHNTLHAFQKFNFHKATRLASEILGYRVSLSLLEFRQLYEEKKIREDILEMIITWKKGADAVGEWKKKALHGNYGALPLPRIGQLRSNWKRKYQIDLDSLVQPLLFRILCSYLDQGISIWNFPVKGKGFLEAIREMEKNSMSSFFRTNRAKKLLFDENCKIEDLLRILVGDPKYYGQYLFDQQFSHQGWSGMVSTVEDHPYTLLDTRHLSMHDLIHFELLLEIDKLDDHFGEIWSPLGYQVTDPVPELFADVPETELNDLRIIWQEAFEWSYYDQVLAGIRTERNSKTNGQPSFQAMFCIDDRECSFRRYLEKIDPACGTYGTPGFFNVEFFYQPEDGKFFTKVCPWPVTPKHLIKGVGNKTKRETDIHFTKHSHTVFTGWLISQTLGFWSALRLFLNIFRPSMGPATASSFQHMDKFSKLTIENKSQDDREKDLQIGFNIEEMTIRLESLLKSTGLVKDFASIVYIIGHGSSSVNNPHYAAYDCGACSGRAGS
ncbi:MAG TPA: Na-translocating system protein MpsB, partial [Cyclobacteriaceae bacterium]|nr:Na-translocating system protein MpsB [Cyclobacteriaceae bacterium]